MTQPLGHPITEPFSYSLDPRAEQYYRGLDPERPDPERVAGAIEDARTRIDEWSYEQDAHGYCHDRTDWIALVAEIQRLVRRERGLQRLLYLSSYRPEDARPI